MPTNFPTDQQITSFLHTLNHLIVLAPWLAVYVIAGILFLRVGFSIIRFSLKVLGYYHSSKLPLQTIELIPPSENKQSIEGMQQFLTMLHGFLDDRSLVDILTQSKKSIALELSASRYGGLGYSITAPKPAVSHMLLYIASYLPEIKVQYQKQSTLQKGSGKFSRVINFKLAGHFAYPLADIPNATRHDPISYLQGSMSKLSQFEAMKLQFVIYPQKHQKTNQLRSKLLNNELQVHRMNQSFHKGAELLLKGMSRLTFVLLDGMTELIHSPAPSAVYETKKLTFQSRQVANRVVPARSQSRKEEKLSDTVFDKLNLDLFQANIRCQITTQNKRSLQTRMTQIKQTMHMFQSTKYQSLKADRLDTLPFYRRHNMQLFERRLPALRETSMSTLSVQELAGLFHFQIAHATKPEVASQAISPNLPMPPQLLERADQDMFDVKIGENSYHKHVNPIGLSAKEREKHMFILGGTGNGKTTMLEYMIDQDIASGKGVAVIDPHGDLVADLLSRIPKQRLKDVIYFNPVDIANPIGINLLELPKGLTPEEVLLEKAKISSSIISVLRKVFSDDEAKSFRIESVLRNTIQTALEIDDATLFTLPKLLRNSRYRESVISKLKDEALRDFWYEEVKKGGPMQFVSMTKGITQRIDHFKGSAHIYRIFSQKKSTINFEDIINNRKILLCNFSVGAIGEDESTLLGTTVLAQLKLAAERRIAITEKDRVPFYVYVDEFQNFASQPFVHMLSSSRKYKLFLTMAEQSTKQQDNNNLTETILSNVGTKICFRTGSHLDEELMLHTFSPFLKQGAIGNLPTYEFYCRIQAVESFAPVSGNTLLLKGANDLVSKRTVITKSREQYTQKYIPEVVEQTIAKPTKPKKSQLFS